MEEAGRGEEGDQSPYSNQWKSNHYLSRRNSLKYARYEEKKTVLSLSKGASSADGPLKQNVHLCTLASTA